MRFDRTEAPSGPRQKPGTKVPCLPSSFSLLSPAVPGHQRTTLMICPACNALACRRSRRRNLMDFAAALVGSLPWRCSRCGKRFRARGGSFSNRLSAHCSLCGNHDLKRIAPEHVTGFWAPCKRLLGMPAYRCIPCRHKFFSIRPLSREIQEDRFRIAS